MPYYAGHARSSLTWADWFEGDFAAAKANGRRSFELWGAMPNPGAWFSQWPLLAIAVAEGSLEEAVGHARSLATPPNMRMPAVLDDTLRRAIAAWERQDEAQARELLGRGVELAQETQWL